MEGAWRLLNSETIDWKSENKKTQLRNSEILLNWYNSGFYFLFFILRFPSYLILKVLFSLNVPPTPYRPSKSFFWIKLQS